MRAANPTWLRSAHLILGSIIALLFFGASVAPPAHADNLPGGGEVGYRVDERFCENDGLNITIGGGIHQKEFDQHGVVQLEVKWLLYNRDTIGFPVAERQKTFRSTPFPDDNRDFLWTSRTGGREGGGRGNYHQWTASASSSWKLVAKLRWKRDGGRRDWIKKVTTTVCS